MHGFSKALQPQIELVAGLGVAGDAHAGATVKHRSRVRVDPTAPNWRQVHLLAAELLDELAAAGHPVAPGDLGENILTHGLDLIALPVDARLVFPSGATLRITGLRNPCQQIEDFQAGLLGQVLVRRPDGSLNRRAGIMAVVETAGAVAPDDTVRVVLPDPPHRPLERV
ncbi:MOSC domain-containing protein [Hyphomicrobiaceae bacterium 22]|uniref:MOSC domain-containing protein n=1 Tax=Prosthecodimorpha staleyi TaxID=2840188 RepID=A0A947D3X4_9HYPH|nr:MOSC domain-containing protein [Prosthecodimorpha staleyi]